MYVIVEDGGRQLKVEEGQVIQIDYRRESTKGDELKLERVLAYSDGEDDIRIGQPALDSVSVTGEVLGLVQGEKLTIQKFRRRKTYRRKTGHRQLYTELKITKIDAP